MGNRIGVEMRGCRKRHPNKSEVDVRCPTRDGLISGRGVVVNVIDLAPCGASGWTQWIYLVRMGDDLRVIPAEFLTPMETGK